MRTAFDEICEDEYSVASDAAQIGLYLVNTLDRHAHLRGVEIAFLFRDEEIRNQTKVEWGSASLNQFNGPSFKRWRRFIQWSLIRVLGFDPTFIILLDRNVWAGLDVRQKLALTDHELTHCAQAEDAEGTPRFNQQTGEPIWCIRPHDIEEFDAIARDHGAWKEDVVSFARALIDGLNHGPAIAIPTQLSEQAAR